MSDGEASGSSDENSDSSSISSNGDEASNLLISRSNSIENSGNSYSSTSTEDNTKSESGYTRAQIIILVSICIGQFFTDACIALPAPFLPQKV